MDEQHSQPADPQPTEEELRAYEEQLHAYEEQLKHVRVEDVLIQSVVSLLNVGAHKMGKVEQAGAGAPGSAPSQQVDLDQLRLAIDGARALLSVVEGAVGDEPDAKAAIRQLRDAISQLQMAYATKTGGGAAAANRSSEPPAPEQGSTPSSGRIWVPGQ